MKISPAIIALLIGVSLVFTACQSQPEPEPVEVPSPAVTISPVEEPASDETAAPEEAPEPVSPAPTLVPAPVIKEPGTAMSPKVEEKPAETAAPPPAAPAEAGVIRLFYYAHVMTQGADPAALSGEHVINSATSSDGINFVEDPGTRFSYDTGSQFGITDPDVVRMDDGSWLMFVSLGQSLLKAASPDSSGTFTRDASFDWNQGGVAGSYNFGGTVRSFTSYGDSIHAAVYDGATGKLQYQGEVISAPSPGTVGSPSLFAIDGLYYMVYAYHPFPGADPRQHEIYMATSEDGLTWTQHDQNRFVCQGSVPGAVYFNGAVYIYYCGVPAKPGEQGDMGVAISTDNGQTFQHYRMIIEGKALSGAVDPAPVVADE